jgi:hypothetical protein
MSLIAGRINKWRARQFRFDMLEMRERITLHSITRFARPFTRPFQTRRRRVLRLIRENERSTLSTGMRFGPFSQTAFAIMDAPKGLSMPWPPARMNDQERFHHHRWSVP